MAQQSVGLPPEADVSADVVIIGSGATGLPAAIVAAEAGASVLVPWKPTTTWAATAILSGGNVPLGGGTSAQRRPGTGLVRPLEGGAREKGVKFLLNYKMSAIIREGAPGQPSGRVLGITAEYTPTVLPGSATSLRSYRSDGNIDRTEPNLTIRAHKAVIVATGGSTSNVNFRRMFDPRLTEVYQVAGEATRNPRGLSFNEFETLLKQSGWMFDRQRSSHRIWYSPKGARLSLQAKGNLAKAYQVRQFLQQYEEELSDEG